jgi:hypothetical protein
MFERRVSVEDVKIVVGSGETIEDYPEDKPYPAGLSSAGGVRALYTLSWLTI